MVGMLLNLRAYPFERLFLLPDGIQMVLDHCQAIGRRQSTKKEKPHQKRALVRMRRNRCAKGIEEGFPDPLR